MDGRVVVWRFGATLAVAGILAVLLAACAVPARRPVPEPVPAPDPVSFVEAFVRKVVAGEHEAAFSDLDIGSLVHDGRPQVGLYRSLTPPDQERYRRDFVEGIYAFLFRDLPPDRATWRVSVPDRESPVVEVAGRPGKVLRLVVQPAAAGLKIVMIERE